MNNLGSAQLDILPFEETPVDLKRQVAERLAAHRARRRNSIEGSEMTHEPVASSQTRGRGNNPIAAAVAERFAHTPSYRAVLAEQAQRAIVEAAREAEAAAAEAEVAARNALAIATAQQQLLDELDQWRAPQADLAQTAEPIPFAICSQPLPTRSPLPIRIEDQERASRAGAPVPAPAPAPRLPIKELSTAGLTVRLYEDIGVTQRSLPASTNAFVPANYQDPDEAVALDEEIAFRQAPVFEPYRFEPTTPLPANLLEFPRQLVAARKARPRFAEGPLREDPVPRSPQLRIFEVEAEQISHTPELASVTPEWANIRLDAHNITDAVMDPSSPAHAILPSLLPPQTAPLGLRTMASAVDLLLVSLGFLGFVAVEAHFASSIPTGVPAAVGSFATLAIFYLLFQLLFFTFSDQTPGMRYARIGLCTLTDENPSRSAMRRRILAQLIAVCPFGLGILWALLDDDGLGWHDRISRMYQRSY